jgi:cleavage and polyadenylation specificity factor subunit 3
MSFDTVVEQNNMLRVLDIVDIKMEPKYVILEWIGGTTSDLIVDSVVAIILSIEQLPASVKGIIWKKER